MDLEFEMNPTLSFFVPGRPAPGGSKRGFAIKKKGRYTGKVAMVDAAGQRNKDWRAVVALVASEHAPAALMRGAVAFSFHFAMPRPGKHFYTDKKRKGKLRSDAPHFHTFAPDTTKLVRSTEDALKGIIWADDCQVVRQSAGKSYGEKPGCLITITPL